MALQSPPPRPRAVRGPDPTALHTAALASSCHRLGLETRTLILAASQSVTNRGCDQGAADGLCQAPCEGHPWALSLQRLSW